MNDDFLHRIRVQPRASFLTSLKAALDRQSVASGPPPPRSLLRVLIVGLLFGGATFAMALLTINGVPDTARNLIQWPLSQSEPKVSPPSGQDGAGRSHASTPRQPESQQARIPGRAPNTAIDDSPRAAGAGRIAGGTEVGAPAGAGGNISAPPITIISPGPLYETARRAYESLTSAGKPRFLLSGTGSTTEALDQFCAGPGVGRNENSPDLAGASRRIATAEFAACTRNIGALAEVKMGYEAIVLVRSKLYGALNLSPRDIFLALAAEVPDPAHPQTLIRNPNTAWSEVNNALEPDRIEVIGPPPKSATDVALREILMQAGCETFPTLAALKAANAARYARVCRTLRDDGTYVELPENSFDLLQRVQATPNAIGITGFGFFFKDSNAIVRNRISGIEPTRENIVAGSYPGSRALYVYVNKSRVSFNTNPALFLQRWRAASYEAAGPTILPATDAELTSGASAALNLNDLKL